MEVNKFMKPEDPFLLITEDKSGKVSYCWWDNETSIRENAIIRVKNGEKIVLAAEIDLYRNIQIPLE